MNQPALLGPIPVALFADGFNERISIRSLLPDDHSRG
jgi:hypothetical protein